MKPVIARLPLALFAAAVLSLAGCWGEGGSSGLGSGGGGGGGLPAGAPRITAISTPTGISTGDITISYTLADPDDDACSIVVQYKGGLVLDWTTAKVTGATSTLVPGTYTIVWNSMSDEAGEIHDDYRVRIIPDDGTNIGAAGVTGAFSLNNNRMPVVTIEPITGSPFAPGEVVGFSFTLVDEDLDDCDLIFEYRGGSVGSTWTLITTVTDVRPAQYGTAWLIASFEAGHCGNNYQLRITPQDMHGLLGTPAESETFIADNVPDGHVELTGCGRNNAGQLGDGTLTDQKSLVSAKGVTDIKAVAAGDAHTVLVDNNGEVWTWGNNFAGQLGSGDTADRALAAKLTLGGTAKAVSAAAGVQHTVVVMDDGSLRVWGGDGLGQLGDGPDNTNKLSPVTVNLPGGALAASAAAGAYHTLVCDTAGNVWACGYNAFGQLGDGTATDRSTFVQVTGLANIAAVAAGASHSVALSAAGDVYTWGRNDFGQLGTGDFVDQSSPFSGPDCGGVVTAIAAGHSHTVALRDDGTVWAWGRNNRGQLGDHTIVDRTAPVQALDWMTEPALQPLAGVTAIAAGSYHSVALLLGTGKVRTWGDNEYGQMGDGTTLSQDAAVDMDSVTDPNGVAAGGFRTCVLLGRDGAHAAVLGAALAVPTSEYPTIQSALDAAGPGARISVAPGRYRENLVFSGRAVAVESQEGPERTVLSGLDAGLPTVTFLGRDGQGASLRGFTIEGGAVAVRVAGAGATLDGNAIRAGVDCRNPITLLAIHLNNDVGPAGTARPALALPAVDWEPLGLWLIGEPAGVLGKFVNDAAAKPGATQPAGLLVPEASATAAGRLSARSWLGILGLLAGLAACTVMVSKRLQGRTAEE